MFQHFEMGPIRPPSEAGSLLIRVTRNCPWNRCTFCPVYKGEDFSLRDTDDIIADIDTMAGIAEDLRQLSRDQGSGGQMTPAVVRQLLFREGQGLQVATFLAHGGQGAFLQDADSLVVKPPQLERILRHLKLRFPSLERITTYARSRTLLSRSVEQLESLREAGLTRVHVGLESGNDDVLTFMKKGVTGAQQVEGCTRVMQAKLELSCYVMPGLGGQRWTQAHAKDTARVLSAIAPDFIRLRTLAILPGSPLDAAQQSGEFEALSDLEIVEEIRRFIEALEEIPTYLASDHVLNLLGDLEGQLPKEKQALLGMVDTFLGLDDETRELFIIGRRVGLVHRPIDLFDEGIRERLVHAREQARKMPGGVKGALGVRYDLL
ncbi:MAG: radical SAM protein [Deltaproteobacteria bacterium]|nr:radical SAM protein [Deltaproteobacteria bacterium]